MIDRISAQSYIPLVMKVINGEASDTEEESDKRESSFWDVFLNDQGQKVYEVSDDEEVTAIISVKGPITKYNQFCGPEGTQSIEKRVSRLSNDPRVKGFIFDIDSPGGQASYLSTLHNTIKSVSKPTTAYYTGMCCSAAYYIASACDQIFANEETDIVGSIGTMISFADMREYFEKEGIKLHEVYADQSSNKNRLFKAALDGDYAQLKKEWLNPLAEEFINNVRESRNITSEEVFKGGTYSSSRAIELGLIDGIKTLDEVINSTLQSKTQIINMKKQFIAVAALLGLEELESHDGGVFLNEDQMEIIEEKLANINDVPASTENEELSNELASMEEKYGNLVSLVERQGSAMVAIKNQLDELSNSPAASASDEPVNASEEMESEEEHNIPDFTSRIEKDLNELGH